MALKISFLRRFLAKLLGMLGVLLVRSRRENFIFPALLKILNIQIVSRQDLLKRCENYDTLLFGSEEFIATHKPYCSGRIPKSIEYTIGQFTIPKPFVSEVLEAELIGSTAVGFDVHGKIISESTLPPDTNLCPRFEGGIPISSLFLSKTLSPEIAQLDIACSLVNYWSKNYYHWIVDCLTRLEGLEHYQEQTGHTSVLLIDSEPHSWQIESLKLLGYESNKCVQWKTSRMKVSKLVVPSSRRIGERPSPSALQWIRQRMLKGVSAVSDGNLKFANKIYVSRARASGRQVINESEVIEALAPLGYVSYSLEEMSFVDQVKLFSGAKEIVAPHGAGLTNIIFSPQNARIIELVTPSASPGYFVPSTILGFHYSCLECQQLAQKFSRTRDNMTVDISELKMMLKQMQNLSC